MSCDDSAGPAGHAVAGAAPAEPVPAGPAAAWPAADIAAAWERELPGIGAGSIEVITPLWRVAKILADERRRTLSRLGIDRSTLDLLSVIRRAGPPYELTTREITARTLVTAGAISQRIARAERAGLVERSPSGASRRAVAVRLTEAGHRLIEPAVRHLLTREASLISALIPAEQRALATTLAKLEHALATQPADVP
ncbi:MAG: MarR family transcriptional regulator [Nocardiopsaceae bacterium]|jgi:DNA-binding MarR family transcriptional regulator|nr:MarR family transcriptional regulator [Nocardiopsaceae bacterium]